LCTIRAKPDFHPAYSEWNVTIHRSTIKRYVCSARHTCLIPVGSNLCFLHRKLTLFLSLHFGSCITRVYRNLLLPYPIAPSPAPCSHSFPNGEAIKTCIANCGQTTTDTGMTAYMDRPQKHLLTICCQTREVDYPSWASC